MIRRLINKIGRISPDFMGRIMVKIPFKFRHGKVYSEFINKIRESEKWNEEELENYVVSRFNKIFQHAKSFRFYRDKYESAGVLNMEVKSIDDIKKIPILTRHEIRDSISEFKGFSLEETGGTSGNPLKVYLDKYAWPREWAHYHEIWSKVGYKYTDAKFVLRKQNSKDNFIKYLFEHNEYVINTYRGIKNNIDEFFKVLTTYNLKYFHGYPSAIYDFLKEIEDVLTNNQKKLLKEQIRCCFFSSEMPLPHMMEYITNKWGFDFIACYGHTEVCVLAATDINELAYYPYHTYGHVEVEDNMLLGTSYHNFDMPLIRYNTDDLVRAIRYSNGIVKYFEVTEGRIFDYIYDRNNLKIPIITMFREHFSEIFKHIDHIQVFQEKKGRATLFLCKNKINKLDTPNLLDLENIDIDFDITYVTNPIRTASGKVPLRVLKLP